MIARSFPLLPLLRVRLAKELQGPGVKVECVPVLTIAFGLCLQWRVGLLGRGPFFYRSKHQGLEKEGICLLVAEPTFKLRTCPPGRLPKGLETETKELDWELERPYRLPAAGMPSSLH